MTRLPLLGLCLLAGWLAAWPAASAPVTHLQVRIVTGATELVAGSVVELRIYEAGRVARRLPLTHGESWPRDSTRLIPLDLVEPLDARTVLRFGVYYRSFSATSPAFEISVAQVDMSPDRATPELLLNATLSGSIDRQGELATVERDAALVACATDADCDDHRSCNGRERCAPRSAGADARGCVKGTPVVCPVNQVCTNEHGCRGVDRADASAPPERQDGSMMPDPAVPPR